MKSFKQFLFSHLSEDANIDTEPDSDLDATVAARFAGRRNWRIDRQYMELEDAAAATRAANSDDNISKMYDREFDLEHETRTTTSKKIDTETELRDALGDAKAAGERLIVPTPKMRPVWFREREVDPSKITTDNDRMVVDNLVKHNVDHINTIIPGKHWMNRDPLMTGQGYEDSFTTPNATGILNRKNVSDEDIGIGIGMVADKRPGSAERFTRMLDKWEVEKPVNAVSHDIAVVHDRDSPGTYDQTYNDMEDARIDAEKKLQKESFYKEYIRSLLLEKYSRI